MEITKNSQQHLFKTTILGLLLVCSVSQAAQPDNSIEQIDITGERSLIQLQRELQQAEAAVFDLYNQLNSTNDFDVSCGRSTPTGSRIPIWECEARYLKRARSYNVQEAMDPMLRRQLISERELQAQMLPQTKQLNAEIIALAKINPQLAQALLDWQAKKQRLDEIEQQRRLNTRK